MPEQPREPRNPLRDVPPLTAIESRLDAIEARLKKQLEINAKQVEVNGITSVRLTDIEARLLALETERPPTTIPPIPPVDPPVVTPPIVTPPPVVTPPIVVTDPVIPQPPPGALNTRDFPGDDLGAKLQAIDDQLGDRPGSIIVQPGTIATPVLFRPKRSYYLQAGEFPLVIPSHDENRMNHSNFVINDHSKVFGQGRERSLFIEPVNGYIVIESWGSYHPSGVLPDALITTDIILAHFGIIGKNTVAEGGVRSTVKLGNAHAVDIFDLLLRDTSCLGITAGGTSAGGNCADGWQVSKCLFEGVGSQAAATVNARHITFDSCTFLRSGKFPSMGMVPIDFEPNSGPQPEHGIPGDVCQDIKATNNLIDSTLSTFQHGNMIVAQNGAGSKDYGPILIEGNKIIGGLKAYVGIYVAGHVQNVTVRENDVASVLQSMYRFDDADHCLMEDNTGIARGRGGSESVDIELINTRNSAFKRNHLTLAPGEAGPMRFLETQGSANNTFEDNVPAAVKVA